MQYLVPCLVLLSSMTVAFLLLTLLFMELLSGANCPAMSLNEIFEDDRLVDHHVGGSE